MQPFQLRFGLVKGKFVQALAEMTGETTGVALSQLLGKSRPYVAQLKNGKRLPTDEDVVLLARAFAPERLQELILLAYHDRLEHKDFQFDHCKSSALKAIEDVLGRFHLQPVMPSDHRNFEQFPRHFEPLVIITGDKRETRGRHMGAGDFGVHATTTADSRWLMSLGLSQEVEHVIDKDFVLLDEPQLIERFAHKNLLVIGSPSVNHLARRINRSSIFRFNINHEVDEGLESIIAEAKLKSKSKDELALFYQQSQEDLTKLMRYLFVGGIIDPSYPSGDYVTSTYHSMPGSIDLDFGVLSFAANPFYEALCQSEGRPNDHAFISIFAAGIHHPATAHAIRQLGRHGQNQGAFENHPYGGVFRVELNLDEPFFSDRVRSGVFQWEDDADDQRRSIPDQGAMLASELEYIENERRLENLNTLQIHPEQAAAARNLLHHLRGGRS